MNQKSKMWVKLSRLPLSLLIRLTSLDELDCSFNEIEALPASIGQCVSIRTFAADHNFLTQLPPEVSADIIAYVCFRLKCVKWCGMYINPSLRTVFVGFFLSQMGNWKNVTVLFLHSNKLESLPDEMGDMQNLKVINLSNNKWAFLIICCSVCKQHNQVTTSSYISHKAEQLGKPGCVISRQHPVWFTCLLVHIPAWLTMSNSFTWQVQNGE